MLKTSRLYIRLTDHEKDLMNRCADEEGVGLSTWVRDRLVAALREGHSALDEGPVGQSPGTSSLVHEQVRGGDPELGHVSIRETQGSVADQAQAPAHVRIVPLVPVDAR